MYQPNKQKGTYQIIGYLQQAAERRSVVVNKDGILFFFMTPLSDFPSSVTAPPDAIQIYGNSLEDWGFNDDYSKTDLERIENLQDFMRDNLIICKTQFRPSTGEKTFYQGFDIELVKKSEVFNEFQVERLIPIPVLNKEDAFNISDEFELEKKLKEGKVIGDIENFSKKNSDFPEYVFWYDEEKDSRVLYGEIVSQIVDVYGTSYIVDPNNFNKFEIDEDNYEEFEYYDDYINEKDNVIFIPERTLDKIIDLMVPVEVEEEESNTEEDRSQLTIFDLELDTTIKENNLNEVKGESESALDEETELLNRFRAVTRDIFKLYYHPQDLYNFHTAMLGDSLVVLSGLSGTGKSQLIKSYARTLLIQNQVSFISVRPFWQDDSDLLGYADTVNWVYRPGDSGLIDALLEARKNPEQLYLICFDEMNLAKVEHYFSQFLSVLEMDPQEREISLYNPELENRLYNSQLYPPKIKIGTNVLFVGTINTDESTHQFSDKVLDRSNIISLSMVPFHQRKIVEQDLQFDEKKAKRITSSDFKALKNSSANNRLTDDELELFWALHELINESDKNIGIGWRIIKQIDEYLANLPKGNTLTRGEALDLQITQRIITKIRGSEEQLSNILGEQGAFEKILDQFATIHNDSDEYRFGKTRKILQQKAKELKIHGFTI